jgi:hypothetical protein
LRHIKIGMSRSRARAFVVLSSNSTTTSGHAPTRLIGECTHSLDHDPSKPDTLKTVFTCDYGTRMRQLYDSDEEHSYLLRSMA